MIEITPENFPADTIINMASFAALFHQPWSDMCMASPRENVICTRDPGHLSPHVAIARANHPNGRGMVFVVTAIWSE